MPNGATIGHGQGQGHGHGLVYFGFWTSRPDGGKERDTVLFIPYLSAFISF